MQGGLHGPPGVIELAEPEMHANHSQEVEKLVERGRQSGGTLTYEEMNDMLPAKSWTPIPSMRFSRR